VVVTLGIVSQDGEMTKESLMTTNHLLELIEGICHVDEGVREVSTGKMSLASLG